MDKKEYEILSKSTIEDIDRFIENAKRLKQNIKDFTENSDLIKDGVKEDVINYFNEMDLNFSNLSLKLEELQSDGKKLKNFLNQIKLLKRLRVKALNKGKKEENSYDQMLTQTQRASNVRWINQI